MSVRLLGRAFYADLPSHLKLLLLAICDEANDDGRGVFIGQERLAHKCGTVDRSVRRNLGQLVADGWLLKLPEQHPVYHTDQYEVVVERLPERSSWQPDISSGRSKRPDTDDQDDRTPTSATTGHRLPPTREVPVEATREISSAPKNNGAPKINGHAPAFDAFWKIYPLKVGKPKAVQAFAKAVGLVGDPEVILIGARRYRDDPNREPGFTAHPTTWLNRAGWDDPPIPSKTVNLRDAAMRQLGWSDEA